MLYRRAFEAMAPEEGKRAWLVLDGIFDASDLWLDGTYLGNTEGYFFPHEFEVTGAVRDRSEHLLAAEVACSIRRGEGRDNPGGIWRAVRIVETGAVRIRRMRVLCTEANGERAIVDVRAVFDSADATKVDIRTTVGPSTEHTQQHALAAGENRVGWRVTVERPELWWPHALGAQPLHEVSVAATVNGSASDERSVRIGLRQVRTKSWVTSINDERIFLKGSTTNAADPATSDAPLDESRRFIADARSEGFDFVRLHSHVAPAELYEAADGLGMLLWQDMPMSGGHGRGARKQAAREAREAVDLLGHHPSIFLWCARSEAVSLLAPPKVSRSTVRRALEKSDPSRTAIDNPPAAPADNARGLARVAAAWPAAVRFVADLEPFWARSLPDTGLSAPKKSGLGEVVAVLRRLKYRPSGGFALSRDVAPDRAPDSATAPVIVAADALDETYTWGDAIELDVHVVSDLREPIADATVRATLNWHGGSHLQSWAGEIPADGCELVGTIRATAPEVSGRMTLLVELTSSVAKASHHDESDCMQGRSR